MGRRTHTSQSRALYGWDSREDVCDLQLRDPISDLRLMDKEIPRFVDNVLRVSESICSIVFHKHIESVSFDHMRLKTQRFADTHSLGADEPFREQPVVGMGTAFLVAPDIVVTAGHVIDEKNIHNVKFVFGYDLRKLTTDGVLVPDRDVVAAKRLLGREYSRQGVDWAVIKLVNNIEHRKFLPKIAVPSKSNRVYTVGHPAGLPLKFSGPGRIRRFLQNDCISTSLDALGGNSGSPVFDSVSHDVVGIIARGDNDYEPEAITGALKTVVLSEHGGVGQICTSSVAFMECVDNIIALQ